MPIRRIAILIVVFAPLLCVVAGWLALEARDATFIAPTAREIATQQQGANQRVITYRMADPGVGWLSTVARRLRLNGWSIIDERYVWGHTERYVPTYVRETQFWTLHIRERVEMRGDREQAHLTVFVSVSMR